MIDGQNFLRSASENDLGTYDNIQKIATGQGHSCLLNWLPTRLFVFQKIS